jgi:hypothetical protein
MATFKNTSGDYTITCASGTGTLYINANVDIAGNVTYIDTTELVITDPFIVLNNSNTGSYLANSGVLTHTANTTYAGLRYNRTAVAWEVSDSTDSTGLTGSWTALLTSAGNTTVAGSNTQIQFNNANNFGASANLTFDSNTNALTVIGPTVLGNTATPSATTNAAAIYNNAVSSGATGVFVLSSSVNAELISATQAKKFSIIF